MLRFRRLLPAPPLRRSVFDREAASGKESASPRRLLPELSRLKPDPRRAKCHGVVWRTVYVLALGRSPLGQSLCAPKKRSACILSYRRNLAVTSKDRTLQEGFHPRLHVRPLGGRPQ